jgi:hypothetical protein
MLNKLYNQRGMGVVEIIIIITALVMIALFFRNSIFGFLKWIIY